MITVDELKAALPSQMKSSVNQEMIDTFNNAIKDDESMEIFKDNLINYISILQNGNFKITSYLNAVKYVSYKLMNLSNKDAYIKTFPQRYQRLIELETSEKDISSYVSAYSKNKLVNKILEQSLVPTWVLNQDLYQKAINVQATLMMSAQSELVRMQAANSLLVNLQKPKEAGPLVNIDMRESTGLQDLKATLSSLAQQQLTLINQGITAKSIAEQKIIEAE